MSVCIRKVLRPAISTRVALASLYPQEDSGSSYSNHTNKFLCHTNILTFKCEFRMSRKKVLMCEPYVQRYGMQLCTVFNVSMFVQILCTWISLLLSSWLLLSISSTLKMEVIYSSETSVYFCRDTCQLTLITVAAGKSSLSVMARFLHLSSESSRDLVSSESHDEEECAFH
jgi:hypothetical protein